MTIEEKITKKRSISCKNEIAPLKRHKQQHNNINNNDSKLGNILKDFFKLFDECIFDKIKQIFPTYISSYEINFKDFKEYLIKNPKLVLEAFKYIYPLVNVDEIDKNEYIKALKEGFKSNNEMTQYMNKYEENILKLSMSDEVFKNICTLLNILFIDIFKRYHNIYDNSDCDKTLKELLIKEYSYRKENNIL